jgi:uncharacterized membrane protein YgcG
VDRRCDTVSTGKERFKPLNPPEKTPDLFEKYLPYALALNVEKHWSAQFTAAFNQASQAGHGYMPVWYLGGTWNALGWAYFSNDLNTRFNVALTAAATPPPGGTSGLGHSGYSGGGGGGGGGGGW